MPSKARRQPTHVATETATVHATSIIPTEIIDEILDHFIADSGPYDDSLKRSLQSYSLVSKSVRTGPLVSRTGPRVQTHVDTAHVFHSLFYYDFITS